jgi:DNA repair protein RadA/Sms
MPRSDTVYVCQSCGSVHAKWAGRCDGCGSWNTLQEESDQRAPMGTAAKAVSKARRSKLELFDLGSETDDPPRFETGLAELDRVAGGGFVPGSAILVGGDPGIGKSTRMLEYASRMSDKGLNSVYISGEESAVQIKDRAGRIKAESGELKIFCENDLGSIISWITRARSGRRSSTVRR